MGNHLQAQKIENKKKYGGFSKEDIEHYKVFYRQHLSDSQHLLSKEKLKNHLQLDYQDVEKIFGFFDFEKSQIIDCYKFICGMTLLRQGTLKEKAEQFFHIFNADESPQLEASELKNFTNAIQKLQ